MKKYVKFDNKLSLITQNVNTDVSVEVVKNINHIIVIDVSGSMYYDLPEIRKNLKNKISSLVKENDTVSIIWFSGKDDAGILKEEVHVNSLKQLNDLNDAIDRYLKPIGLTAFAKPLELTNDIIERIKSKNPDSIFSLVFMSDGWNNNVSWDSVIKAVNEISPKLSSSVIVEYGYYADSKKLTELSDILGGEKISCSGFEEYDVVIGKNFDKTLSGGKKTVIDINPNYLYNFAFSISADGGILMYNINDNKITIGNDVKEVHYFSPNPIGVEGNNTDKVLYAAIYTLSERLYNDDAEKVFYTLGDQHYYQMLVNAFGKQKLNTFKSAIKECVADVSKRYPNGGKVQIKPVPDDAYCLMNLIEDLGNLEDCLFYPNHESFKYNRIGRKKIASAATITETEKKKLSEAKDIEELTKLTAEIAKDKVEAKFENDYQYKGYPLTDLVWNENRANLSVRVYITGVVTLPENEYGIDKIPSFKYNTFTIIKDGILNIQKLPVKYSTELETLLVNNGVKYRIDEMTDAIINDSFNQTIMIIDLSSLPIINRKMVKTVSAFDLAKLQWELVKLQGEKKVYDYYKKNLFPKTSKSFLELGLTEECVNWLKNIGITDYNGFSPKVTNAESTDYYMSVVLDTKIKNISSLPKVEDVVAKIKSGKELLLREYVMGDAINKYLSQLDSDIYKSLDEEQQKGILQTYLETKSSILNKQRRNVLQKIAEIKFSMILSRKWFTEFKSFDENKLNVNFDGKDLDFTFVLNEEMVKI